jgi:DNA-binding MarR family transcriptional regulator
MKRNETKFDEVRKALSSLGSVQSQGVEQIMQVLDKQKLLHYSSGGEAQLFSSSGRVLYTLMDDPTITVRALAIYLDLSENMVERIIKSLITEGLITKTKYERKNVYSFNKEKIKNHPDIQRLETIITLLFNDESSEEEPF